MSRLASRVKRCAFIRPEIAAGKRRPCHAPANSCGNTSGGHREVAVALAGVARRLKGCHQSVTSLSSNAR